MHDTISPFYCMVSASYCKHQVHPLGIYPSYDLGPEVYVYLFEYIIVIWYYTSWKSMWLFRVAVIDTNDWLKAIINISGMYGIKLINATTHKTIFHNKSYSFNCTKGAYLFAYSIIYLYIFLITFCYSNSSYSLLKDVSWKGAERIKSPKGNLQQMP